MVGQQKRDFKCPVTILNSGHLRLMIHPCLGNGLASNEKREKRVCLLNRVSGCVRGLVIVLFCLSLSFVLRPFFIERALGDFDVYDVTGVESDVFNKSGPPPPLPVDIVYTWAGEKASKLDPRARDNHEMLFSLRSVSSYLPWVRHIYIVVPDDCAVPSWMDSQALHFHPTDSPILFTFINSEGPSLLFIKQSSIFLDPVDGDRNKVLIHILPACFFTCIFKIRTLKQSRQTFIV